MPGLDKAARLAAEATAAREALEERTRSLDPLFPYKVEPFDPVFFSIPADPEPIAR